MDTELTVVVVLVALAVIAGVALLAVQGRRRKQERQRIEAAEQRHEAEIRSASARRREAEASELAARARQDREAAEERHAAANRIDPDRGTPGGWHGPSASGGFPAVDPASREPVVPAQRTGEHDRDRREPADDEHSGPVRALTDRLLRRRG